MSQILVPHVPHVYQFQAGRSAYRCVPFVLSALKAFAYPGRVPDLNEEAHEIYEHYTQAPDNPANTQGMTKEQAIDFLNNEHIGFHDVQPLIDAGDMEELRHELAAMNKCGIPQLLTIADESHLRLATNGEKLHSWNDVGLSHCFIRLGYDVEQPFTLILDPACPCPPFPFPTPVKWADIAAGTVITALGIMPPGVSAPPADFRFHQGDQDFLWPVPKPKFDAGKAESTVAAMSSAMSQAISALQASQAAMSNLEHDLAALKDEV